MKSGIVVAAAALLSLGAVVLLAGCGSSDDSTSNGGSTLNGTVMAPRSEMLQAKATTSLSGSGRSFLASLGRDLFGAPANADTPPGSDAPLANATVVVVDRVTQTPLADGVKTDSAGAFSLTNVPQRADLELEAQGQGAGGPLLIRALVPAGGASHVNLDEISTMAATAAERAEIEAGLSPSDAEALAQKIAQQAQQDEQQDLQAGKPDHIPDLHMDRPDANRTPLALAAGRIHQEIAARLGGSADHFADALQTKLQQQLEKSDTRQQVVSAVILARTSVGSAVPFNPGWLTAAAAGPSTVSDSQVAAALVAGGVSAATKEVVDQSLAALSKTLGATVAADKVPLGVAFDLALQKGPLQVTTADAMDRVAASLTGQTIAPTRGNSNPFGLPPGIAPGTGTGAPAHPTPAAVIEKSGADNKPDAVSPVIGGAVPKTAAPVPVAPTPAAPAPPSGPSPASPSASPPVPASGAANGKNA